jgi:IS5 family transposase
MRKRFEQQLSFGTLPINSLVVNPKSRDAPTKIALALLALYNMPSFNEELFDILERKILRNKKQTGRPGMDLWQIFVMAQFRVGLNLSYDRLQHMCEYDSMLRTLLGIESSRFTEEKIQFSYQNILDNVGLLDDDLLKDINTLIVKFGTDVFKKKEESLSLKTDSYVVESNVHFPTDYNLLWDSLRKATDVIIKFVKEYSAISGWRKVKQWQKEFKNASRRIGQISGKGGKNKEERLCEQVLNYTLKTKEFLTKLNASLAEFPLNTTTDMIRMIELEEYKLFIIKQLDLLERRVLKGEQIPHDEKIFSIFETYTEWINKGKKRPNVELGKKLAITSNGNNLIVDYRIMENQADSEIVIDIVADILKVQKVKNWSFDKGYYHNDNKELLKTQVENVIMPKKGKCNKAEAEEESTKVFKKLRNKHSAIESNINELEHRGLDRCPDRGYEHFKRYVALGVCAYNLHKIGAELRKRELAKQQKLLKKAA